MSRKLDSEATENSISVYDNKNLVKCTRDNAGKIVLDTCNTPISLIIKSMIRSLIALSIFTIDVPIWLAMRYDLLPAYGYLFAPISLVCFAASIASELYNPPQKTDRRKNMKVAALITVAARTTNLYQYNASEKHYHAIFTIFIPLMVAMVDVAIYFRYLRTGKIIPNIFVALLALLIVVLSLLMRSPSETFEALYGKFTTPPQPDCVEMAEAAYDRLLELEAQEDV